MAKFSNKSVPNLSYEEGVNNAFRIVGLDIPKEQDDLYKAQRRAGVYLNRYFKLLEVDIQRTLASLFTSEKEAKDGS